MSTVEVEIRSGAYYDSIVLMHLQSSLQALPGVIDAGVVMGIEANKRLLEGSRLLVPRAASAGPEDLVIVVRGEDAASAQAAISQVDHLIASRRSPISDQEYHPKTLRTAHQVLPGAQWVLVSVPGRYAAGVAHQSLDLGKHVFLYSDNVAVEDEIALKRSAANRGLLVMGPDCGTAIINGAGLGFANRVRRGPIGIVAASGTGTQQVSSRIHQLGGGITHAIGTGGRDLSAPVGGITTHMALDLLQRDPQSRVIVLISKPPAPEVAASLIESARMIPKPVVINFIGYAHTSAAVENIHFASTFDEAAFLAVQLADSPPPVVSSPSPDLSRFAPGQRCLRGLFSGGTLAYEALHILEDYLPAVYSNIPLKPEFRLADSLVSRENTILDLGEDEFTVGRLHPMMDNDLRIRRMEVEARDSEVALILLDVVLGYGAHPDPAGELSPTITRLRCEAEDSGCTLEVVAIVSGTDEDPQDMSAQIEQLESAGVKVFTSSDQAVRYAGRLVAALDPASHQPTRPAFQTVDPAVLEAPFAAFNLGLDTFAASLISQGSEVLHLDWRPPAGGDEGLIALLNRLKS